MSESFPSTQASIFFFRFPNHFQEYTADLYLRQLWLDDRLAFNHTNDTVTLGFDYYDVLWVPDLFIKNMRRGTFHDITVPNRLLRLSPDGTIYYSQRSAILRHDYG